MHKEVNALRNLRHGNIAQLFQILHIEGHFFLALELVESGDLFDYVLERGMLRVRNPSFVDQPFSLGSHTCYPYHGNTGTYRIKTQARSFHSWFLVYSTFMNRVSFIVISSLQTFLSPPSEYDIYLMLCLECLFPWRASYSAFWLHLPGRP
jgi:hypothetical protein